MKLEHLDLVKNLIRKELQVRYMGSSLGILWSLGSPLITTLTYFVVFTMIFPSQDPKFPLYLITGILHWTLVVQIVPQSCDWLINNAGLIRKISFPRVLIPISGLGTVVVFWLSALIVYLCSLPFLGGTFSWSIAYYPFILFLFISFLFGIGLILSIFYVHMRDIKHIVEVTLPILFWLTPIVWMPQIINENLLKYLNLNPISVYFRCFESIFYTATTPIINDILLATTLSISILILGLATFKKFNKNIVETL